MYVKEEKQSKQKQSEGNKADIRKLSFSVPSLIIFHYEIYGFQRRQKPFFLYGIFFPVRYSGGPYRPDAVCERRDSEPVVLPSRACVVRTT